MKSMKSKRNSNQPQPECKKLKLIDELSNIEYVIEVGEEDYNRAFEEGSKTRARAMWRDLWLRGLLTCAIGACSVLGDFGLKYGKNESERAVFDNMTHATVGGLTWTLVVVLSRKPLVRELGSIVACFLMASFIDLDHFIAARSWHIHDATHLQKRPFLHCTTIPIILWVLFISLSNTFHSPILKHTSWMILASFLSHHIRDGTRRGLWFCPFGSTRPIPYYLYVSLCMFLPYILYYLMSLHTFAQKSNSKITLIDI